MSESNKILNWRFIFLLVIAVVLYVTLLRVPKPCEEPLTYRIGRVDERFGLSRPEFSLAVRKAAAIWGEPLSRELFREDSEGKIDINLIYDYRQETSNKLRQINSRIGDTKDTYENIKMRCDGLKSEYDQKRSALEDDLHAYNARINAYNAEVASWNRRGGASETDHSRLLSEKNELDSVHEGLKIRQDEVNRLAEDINSTVRVMNEVAARQNLDVGEYQEVGSRLNGEFQEGFFESKEGKQSITIYHFDNEAKLVRLLVHELGHALRLGHSENPRAVMYRLNQDDASDLTEDDIAALRARCEDKKD
jgi:chromosome segregation ATPase